QSVQEKLANVDLPSYGGVVAHSYLPSNWLSALGLFAGWLALRMKTLRRRVVKGEMG
ncbi:hypothetical protein ISX56_27295, partial [Serratia ureilytica]|nr:hypothetical protein [Serratia ureilytica]